MTTTAPTSCLQRSFGAVTVAIEHIHQGARLNPLKSLGIAQLIAEYPGVAPLGPLLSMTVQGDTW